MPPLHALEIHRGRLIGDLVEADLQALFHGTDAPDELRMLVVGAERPMHRSLREMLPNGLEVVAIDGPATVPGDELFDYLVHLGDLDGARLDELRRRLSPTALVVVDPASPGPQPALLSALRSRWANVLELAQSTVHGSAITSVTQAPGIPRVTTLRRGSEHPTRGAPQEHTIFVAADRSLDSRPTTSVLHVDTARTATTPVQRVGGEVRRVSAGLQRRLQGGAPAIELPADPEPELSILIPVHGQWRTTEQCLAAIAALGITTPTEVVVIDDASPDDTRARLAGVVGARVVALDRNVGFVHACNEGIAASRGELVLLLNNDTIPQPGSIDALVDRIRSDASIGAVGAKLVYLDQSLQEAGGVIWNEGSGANLGRDRDPSHPRYSYPLEVDYCSGAALLVRRELLDLTGGFDPRFAPAYYEDTDLCFEARRHGYRVMYEPRARIVHLEGQTHGSSLDSGVKQNQVHNRGVFVEKWRDELTQHFPPFPRYEALAKTRTATSRVLIVDHTVPTYDRDGGSMRMLRLIRMLRAGGAAVWFVPMDRTLRQPYTQTLLDLGVELIAPTDDLRSLLRDLAPGLDVAIVSRRGVAWGMVDMLREEAPATPIVFDTVDLHFVREEAEAGDGLDTDAALQARRGRRMELALVGVFDQTWVVSEEEQRLLRKLVPDADVRLVPNVHDATPTEPGFDARRDLLFVGNFHHPPNVDGLRWTAEELVPLLAQELPDVRVQVVGGGLPDDIRASLGGRFDVHGWVEDLTPLYATARLAFAPLRYGAGMKGKVAEALAMGVPVITTPTGTEGMPDAVRALAAEGTTAQEIVDHTVALYGDAARWEEIHRRAPEVVADAFGHDAVRQKVDEALQGLRNPRR